MSLRSHTLTAVVLAVLSLSACGAETEVQAPAPTTPSPSASQTPTAAPPTQEAPDLASFPLEAGFSRDDSDYQQKKLDKPSDYIPCGVERWSPPKPLAWRGVELAGPEDNAVREVFVFDTEATAKAALDALEQRVCAKSATEGEQSAHHSVTRTDVDGRDTLVIGAWYQSGEHLTPGIEGLSLSRSGRNVLLLKHYTEGSGKQAAEALAQGDLGDVERLLMGLAEL